MYARPFRWVNAPTEPADDKEKTMPGLPTTAIPGGFVVSFYLNDRELRISVARVGDHLYASDDLCTCTGHAAAAWGGESDG
jgi:hypothetical protein